MSQTTQKESLRFFAQMLSSFCLMVLVPIAGWSLRSQINFQRDAHARLSVIENWVEGRPPVYTREAAQADLGHLVEKVNDHELRVRDLERE